jgi:hypothetical protein
MSFRGSMNFRNSSYIKEIIILVYLLLNIFSFLSNPSKSILELDYKIFTPIQFLEHNAIVEWKHSKQLLKLYVTLDYILS